MADAINEKIQLKLNKIQLDINLTKKNLQIISKNHLRKEKIYSIIKYFEKELKIDINSLQLKYFNYRGHLFNENIDISRDFLLNIENFKTILNNSNFYKKISKKINKTDVSCTVEFNLDFKFEIEENFWSEKINLTDNFKDLNEINNEEFKNLAKQSIINVIEITTIKKNLTNEIIIVLDLYNKHRYFNSIKDLFEFLNNEQLRIYQLKKKPFNVFLFTANLNIFSFLIYNYNNFSETRELVKINYIMERGEFYEIKFKFTRGSFVIKNFEKFIPLSVIEINKKLQKNYIFNSSIYNLHKNSNLSRYEIIEMIKINIIYIKEILQLIDQFIKKTLKIANNWKISSFSISSLAIFIYKNKFKTTEDNILKLSLKDEMIFRKSLFGGRCEVFENLDFQKNSSKEFFTYCYDKKNMYASTMLYDFPIDSYEIYNEEYILLNEENFINENGLIKTPGFYQIYAKYDNDEEFPNFPFKLGNDIEFKENSFISNFKNKVLFPTGYINGLYWWENINQFLQKNQIKIKIKKAYIWKKFSQILKKFAAHMIHFRHQSLFNKFFCKIILVSFYGRLAMNQKNSHTQLYTYEEYEENEENLQIISEIWYSNYVIVEVEKNILTEETIKSNLKELFLDIRKQMKKKILNEDSWEIIVENHWKTTNSYLINSIPTSKLIKEFLISELSKINQNSSQPFNLINEEFLATKIYKIYISNTFINSNVILASIIASRAQFWLNKNIENISKNSGIILYCDTDSIFFASKKNFNAWLQILNVNENIEIIHSPIFASQKTYAYKKSDNSEIVKILGAPGSKISYDEFHNIFFNNFKTSVYVHHSRVNQYQLQQKDIKTTIDINNYDKREFSINKIKTRPWKIIINKGNLEII